MAVVYLMAAKDSVTGDMYSWTSQNTPDFGGVAYPGPNTPTEIQQRGRNGVPAGGGGGGVPGLDIPDADTEISVADGNIRAQVTQTADREHTLDVDNAVAGSLILYSRGTEAFTTTFIDETDGSVIVVLPSGEAREVEFTYDGFYWGLT